jgi:FKBP-type peptidyl-prolyl cis-trans isomerase FkpA
MKKTLKIIASILLITSIAACGGGGSTSTPAAPSWETTSGSDAITKLQVTDTTVGTGATAAAGSVVTVNYTGWLYQAGAANSEGPQFDTTSGRSPFSFQLGAGQVIAGWDQGLVGMKVGGTRTLVIPSVMGYGSAGYGSIPGGAALVFSVQLVSIAAPAQ